MYNATDSDLYRCVDPDQRSSAGLQRAILHLLRKKLSLPADVRFLAAGVALSIFGWTAPRAFHQGDLPAAAGSGLALLVALLFLRQERPTTQPTLQEVLLSIPALVGPGLVAAATTVGPLLFRLRLLGAGLGISGCLLAGISLVTLGRSFGVFPARRSLVTRGPYQLVRHPAYLGELLAVTGLLVHSATPAALLATLLVMGAVVLRIRLEEKILAEDTASSDYRRRVRYRLLPYVW